MPSEGVLHDPATPPVRRHPWCDEQTAAIADAEYELQEEHP